jgi:zinc transport system substrate-binding protein
MRKSLLFVAISMITVGFFFYSCSTSKDLNEGEYTDGNKRLQVIATIFPQYDFAKEIVGDKADVSILLPPGAESHSFEPTPADILKIKDCDVFIYVGGESEEWVERILETIDMSGKKIISLMELTDVVEEEIVEGMQEEEAEEGAKEVEYDEHVWTSPKNAIKIVKGITEGLSDKDKENADEYRKNADEYIKKLESLDLTFENIVKEGKRNVMIFADRFPLRYFAKDYKLTYFAAFPGCSTETEASVATVAFLINKVKAEKIPAVFYIEFSNQRMANAICESSKAKKLLFHSCHNVSSQDFQNGVSYLDLMLRNTESLKEALR